MDRLEAELAITAEREPTVAAWVSRRADDEVRAAMAGAPAGSLNGFTLGVKDIIDTADLPTEKGSAIYAGHRPRSDAAAVALARAAGAVVVGKTVTTEFAFFRPGPTTNPHDPTRTPGGSSSGSAAAVAAGMVRVAFGTQTGGSVIRPGSFCGVVAFKPTFDLVALTGVHPLAPSFDTLGWYGTTVDDVAAVLAALAPPGPPAEPPASRGGADRPAPRIGRYRSHQWPAAEMSTVTALEMAASSLAAAGAEVVDVDLIGALGPLGAAHDTIMAAEIGASLAWEHAAHPDLLSDRLAAIIEARALVSPEAYGAAQRDAVAGRAAYAATLARLDLDALLTPSAPGEAPLGLDSTGDPAFNKVWTLLRVPALSLPGARGPARMPVGVQLVGTRWADHALLDVGRFAAAALGSSAP